ncbi:MAG TPA: hypothetical protein VJS38_00770 [Phenylobacterium sp.]|uniref:hypothetical protein n=1 Tax=Phenylobacterium sp. TaxID=1871053 RepID=UPI002B47FE6F|nr:hypothetical protein [Phenylobacterium sp.]HKR86685.1 hypothetical protein [Phenylobacterium sp.]
MFLHQPAYMLATRPGAAAAGRRKGCVMNREKTEKLGSIFLAVFSGGLAAQLAADGMAPGQWLGAAAAVLGSLAMAAAVRLWPQPQAAEAPARRRSREP